MTNEELLATSEVYLIKAQSQPAHAHEIEWAIQTLNHAIGTGKQPDIDFARAVLFATIDDFQNEKN